MYGARGKGGVERKGRGVKRERKGRTKNGEEGVEVAKLQEGRKRRMRRTAGLEDGRRTEGKGRQFRDFIVGKG